MRGLKCLIVGFYSKVYSHCTKSTIFGERHSLLLSVEYYLKEEQPALRLWSASTEAVYLPVHTRRRSCQKLRMNYRITEQGRDTPLLIYD